MSFLAIRDLSKSFAKRPVADRISLSVGKGEIIVVLGPSGCGKTTLLRMISGLETPDAGAIEMEGRNILPVPPHRRDIAMVFQNYALYPHMTARENIGFALKMAGVADEPRGEAVARTSAMLGIAGLLDKYPAQCSGGERQRIALGRAVIRNPRLFLFDEPLSNLDAGLRERLRIELRTTLKKLGATALYVTHDQAEAMALADRVAIIIDGRIVQTAPPREIYERPATTFVASFIGRPEINRFPGNAADGLFSADAAFTVPCPSSVAGRVELLLRPESMRAAPQGFIPARITSREYQGDRTVVQFASGRQAGSYIALQTEGVPEDGAQISLSCLPDSMLWFDAVTGTLLMKGNI